MGNGTGFRGIIRATIGQVMAFLIASPWNSFSLTMILFALIGLKWTLFFIFASMLIALLSGWIFDLLEKRGVLPANPHTIELAAEFDFWYEVKARLSAATFKGNTLLEMVKSGILDSRMVVRWILFGVLLASLIRTFVDVSLFQHYFGPTLVGLLFTIAAATIIEVCSKGSAPIAAAS